MKKDFAFSDVIFNKNRVEGLEHNLEHHMIQQVKCHKIFSVRILITH